MRIGFALCAALLVSAPGIALAQDKDEKSSDARQEPERKICRNENKTGSLVRRTRTCKTEQEWTQESDATRADMEHFDRVQSRAYRTDPRTGQIVPD